MGKLAYQHRILMLALLSGLPAVVAFLLLLWTSSFSSRLQWSLTILIVGFWLAMAALLGGRVVRPLQTITNLLSALREGDYSIRAHTSKIPGDLLSEIGKEINALEATLRAQRLGAVEASALVRKVIDVIDDAIFAFDGDQRVRLVNRAGESLLARPSERLIGHSATELELTELLEGESRRTIHRTFPGKTSRWGLRRASFREEGRSHQLLVITDLSQALREEERQAWQRLVRVLGHELNNSLTPIKSMANSLSTLLKTQPRPEDWEEDVKIGLQVIDSRSDSLTRFMKAYSRLARLPQPKLSPVSLSELARRVARLETRLPVDVEPGPEIRLKADSDQLEQVLINLLRNAVDAAQETSGKVKMSWSQKGKRVVIRIQDEGPGLPNTSNLFVPFFTTKPGGSGIGLVLSRQIAEGHGGSLILRNRSQGGCEALLELPV